MTKIVIDKELEKVWLLLRKKFEIQISNPFAASTPKVWDRDGAGLTHGHNPL